MKNKLTDLNNHLFAELERLSDEDMSDEQLSKELKRADAIGKISAQIINNGHLALNAAKICLTEPCSAPIAERHSRRQRRKRPKRSFF